MISLFKIFSQSLYIIIKSIYSSFPTWQSKFLRLVIMLFIIWVQFTFPVTYISYSPFFSLSHFTYIVLPACAHIHTHAYTCIHTQPLTSICKLIYMHPFTHSHRHIPTHQYSSNQTYPCTPQWLICPHTSTHIHTSFNNSYPSTYLYPLT